jgi:hypothetical protein
MVVLAYVDANEETFAARAVRLGIVPSTFNTTVKNGKDTEEYCTKYSMFSGQSKGQSSFQEGESLLALWFNL